jgi:hypothetical protein
VDNGLLKKKCTRAGVAQMGDVRRRETQRVPIQFDRDTVHVAQSPESGKWYCLPPLV